MKQEKIELKDYGIELHLVRHGEYVLNKVGGWTDDHLSKKGISQIEEMLKDVDSDYDVFISSDLVRAKDTSLIINKKLNMEIIYDPGFREINSGILNNVTLNELKANPSMWVDYTRLKMDEAFPDGDSPNSFYKRVRDAFYNLINKNKGKKIILVSHSGVITVILCLINGHEYKNDLNLAPEVGSILKLK